MASNLRKMPDLEFVSLGDNEFDVIAGDVVVELSRDEDGTWRFWNVRIGEDRFGGTRPIGPGAFHDWLNAVASQEEPA